MSRPLSPAVRDQLGQALDRSTAFRHLPPHEQRSMMENLETVMGSITQPPLAEAMLTPAGAVSGIADASARIAEAGAQTAQARADAAGRIADARSRTEQARLDAQLRQQQLADESALRNRTLSDMEKGVAAHQAGDAFASMVKSVDFGAFVKSLINNVYDAIVHSSIEQMQAYAQLLQDVVGPASKFAGQISDNEASNYLVGLFPSALQMVNGQPVAHDDAEPPDFSKKIPGAPANADLSDPDERKKLVNAAKLQMAQQNQHLLATMVMMGINRIIVTDGSINARIKINASGQNAVNTSNVAQRGMAGLGNAASASGGDLSQQAKIGVQTDAGELMSQSENYVRASAELYGAVSVNFKSETMPLEDIMGLDARAKLADKKAEVADGQKRYSGRGEPPYGYADASMEGPRGTQATLPEVVPAYGGRARFEPPSRWSSPSAPTWQPPTASTWQPPTAPVQAGPRGT